MSRFAGLPDRLSTAGKKKYPKVETPDDDDTETPDEIAPADESKEKEKPKMVEQETAQAVEAAKAEATAAANARFAAVLASEEYKGREALGNHLLANTGMDADGIVATLAAAPKPGAAEVNQAEANTAAEEAARGEMRNVLGADKNSNLDAGGNGQASEAEAVAAGWSKAMARANSLAGLN